MIRVGCLGAGYFSQFHIDSWDRIAGAECVAVADQDVARAQATGRPAYATLSQMIADRTLDILDIILPPAGHADAIQKGLNAGIKTIICQKPFCTTLEEARAITDAARDAGATLIIHENFRFQPWFRAIKASIDAGAIGEVQQMTFRLRPGDGQGPDAYLDRQPYFQTMPRFLVHETGVHYVDVFRYLLGQPTAVYADLRRVNPAIAGEDAGLVILDHTGGKRALIDGNRCLDHPATNTRCTMGEGLFEGTDGTLSLLGDGSVHLRKFGATENKMLLAPNTSGNFGGDCTHALQAHIIGALTNDMPIENLAGDYLTVIETELAIYRSAETRTKLDLPFDASSNG